MMTWDLDLDEEAFQDQERHVNTGRGRSLSYWSSCWTCSNLFLTHLPLNIFPWYFGESEQKARLKKSSWKCLDTRFPDIFWSLPFRYEQRSRSWTHSDLFTTPGAFLEYTDEQWRLGRGCRRPDSQPLLHNGSSFSSWDVCVLPVSCPSSVQKLHQLDSLKESSSRNNTDQSNGCF